jgi:hypothetical protein
MDFIQCEPLIPRYVAQIHRAKGYNLNLMSSIALGLDGLDLKYRNIFLSSNLGHSLCHGRLVAPDRPAAG